MSDRKKRCITYLFIFLTAFVTLLICSKSSPLYPFNDWIDANCFMTVGKSMWSGLVPYRDLYEQKGPILYMVHALAALISDTSFIGVWMIEVLCAFLFLSFCWQFLEKQVHEHALFWIPVISAVTYSSLFFCHGDSAEEMVLPVLAYVLFNGMNHIREKSQTENREFLLMGFLGGIVLWIKYTLLGIFPAWGICAVIPMLARKDFRSFFKALLYVLAGVGIASVPVLIYFGLNHAITDLWQVYFIDNLFVYSSESSGLLATVKNVVSGMQPLLYLNRTFVLLMFLGAVYYLFSKQWKELCGYLFMIALTGTFAFIGGTWFQYYSLIFAVFLPAGVLCLEAVFSKAVTVLCVKKYMTCAVMLCLCTVYAYHHSTNTYLLGVSKDELPQYQFNEIIQTVENPTLLNYGFLDGGFYTVSDIVPTCRYFAKLNIPLQEMTDEQNRVVENREVDFVVTRNEEEEQIREFDGYDIVAESDYTFEGSIRHYTLYRKTEK